MPTIKALAAHTAGGPLEPFTYEVGPVALEEVEVEIEYTGICHSDLSMLDNEWGITTYPFVPGHEAIGRITAMGDVAQTKGLTLGQRVGVGWMSVSCLHCPQCIRGHQQLCLNGQPTIVGHHGSFATRVRAHWLWAIPIPEALDSSSTGPMLCGGITVFAPLLHLNTRGTARVGVFGIGGLGHMALMFLKAWGCEVVAFSSSPSKAEEARGFGASKVVNSRSSSEMTPLAGTFDLILITANASLDWAAILNLLAPGGKLHFLGAVLEPVPVQVFSLILGQKSISGSPTGSRGEIDSMLAFAARHNIHPKVEHFPMSKANEAMEHLRAGKANYRIVLDADL